MLILRLDNIMTRLSKVTFLIALLSSCNAFAMPVLKDEASGKIVKTVYKFEKKPVEARKLSMEQYGKMASAEDRKEQINKKAKDLEAVFISKMVDPMFPEGKESGLYGGHEGAGIYRAMMVQEYGKILEANNGLGLANNIASNLK